MDRGSEKGIFFQMRPQDEIHLDRCMLFEESKKCALTEGGVAELELTSNDQATNLIIAHTH